MFHSYHNGGMTLKHKQDHHNVWSVLVRATMQTYAASNYMWISVNNTTRRESSGSSFVVGPDGLIDGRLPLHRAGVLVTTIDTETPYFDASKEWRSRAMSGIFHSGTPVDDPRSENRTCL
jgi:predicted amidohydrolase